MTKFLPILVVALLVSLAFNVKLVQQRFSGAKVVAEVADGDTFQLASGERVRLMGVDAPEFGRCGAPEAKKRLTELILGKEVRLAEGVEEKYGRTMALVYVGKTLVNQIILAEGWGRPDYRKNSQRDSLSAAYAVAREKNFGLWGKCLEETTANKCNIKGNVDAGTYQKFYHLPSCPRYKQTVLNLAYGDQWFCSEKEATAAGFVKAASCP